MGINDIVVDILPLALLALVMYKAKLSPKSKMCDDYLSIDTGKYYRGIFALVVVFHHLAQRTETGIIFHKFTMVGFLAVAFFFFLSGYGLQKSYIRKSTNYTKGFLLKRLPAILIPYIIVTIIFWIFWIIGGHYYSLNDIIVTTIKGNPIVSFSWYIINILVFYIVYWILMKVCRSNHYWMIILGIVWYFAYVFVCMKLGYGGWWYISTQLLIVGMFWAVYENKIIEIIRRFYYILAPLNLIMFLVLFIFKGKIVYIMGVQSMSLVFTLILAILFVLVVLFFSLKVQIGNSLLESLGNISLEIYITQGLFMIGLRNGHIFIKNELVWCVMVLCGTVLFSYVLHMIFQAILNKYKGYMRQIKMIE